MNFFIRQAPVDPFVHYHGKTLPTDKAPVRVEVADPNVSYNGHSLPADKVTYQRPQKDLTNNPSRILLAGLQLPGDCAIYITGMKELVMTNILDGPTVFERILRKPYELEFEMVLRTPDPSGNGQYIFPQEDLLSMWNKVWLPDSVLTIDNTYLNKLGIQEMIVRTISPQTIRGSKNVPVRISGYENQPGQSLIIG